MQRGHTLVIPRNHCTNILDLSPGEYTDLMMTAKDVAHRMRSFFNVPRIAFIVEGMSVAHVHVHLVPVSTKGQLGTFSRYHPLPGEMSHLGEQLRELQ